MPGLVDYLNTSFLFINKLEEIINMLNKSLFKLENRVDSSVSEFNSKNFQKSFSFLVNIISTTFFYLINL